MGRPCAVPLTQGQALTREGVVPGLGWGRVDYRVDLEDGPFMDDRGTGLAVQAFGGLVFDVTPRVDVAVEFRAWIAPSLEVDSAAGDDLETFHSVYSAALALSYRLGDR